MQKYLMSCCRRPKYLPQNHTLILLLLQVLLPVKSSQSHTPYVSMVSLTCKLYPYLLSEFHTF